MSLANTNVQASNLKHSTWEGTWFESRMGQVRFLHGIQIAEAGYRYQLLGLVPYLGEAY